MKKKDTYLEYFSPKLKITKNKINNKTCNKNREVKCKKFYHFQGKEHDDKLRLKQLGKKASSTH